MRAATTILVTLIFIFVACDNDSTPVTVAPDETPTVMERVIANTDAVRDALEAYALDNAGLYPRDVPGANLADYLPDGVLIENPVTGDATEPRDIDAIYPDRPAGSVIFRPYWLYDFDDNYNVIVTGYTISGVGESSEEYTLANLPPDAVDRFEVVKQNCWWVMTAAEAFAAENGGVYPTTSGDVNQAGKTLILYLPQRQLMVNPFTLASSEPVTGAAADFGSTGYLSIDLDGDGTNDGYVITGIGSFWAEEHSLSNIPQN